jgi:AcrR family transcriptional regulator
VQRLECPLKVGLRERNKTDKLERIKVAARKLFTEHGYEATTTRKIAEIAGVSQGTIFVYAADKGDLVCLMACDRLKRRFAEAFESCDHTLPLLEQLVSVCRHMFVDSARDVPLSRILIKEMMAYRNKHQIDEWIITRFESMLLEAMEKGEISFDEDPAFVARVIDECYLAEMRSWIMTVDPKPAEGLANLRRTFVLLLRGLNYGPTVSGHAGDKCAKRADLTRKK